MKPHSATEVPPASVPNHSSHQEGSEDTPTKSIAVRVSITLAQIEAIREEQAGCFGAAEQQWELALKLALKHFPADALTASVAASLGLFYHRFLPRSQFAANCFRIARDIEKHLGGESATTLLNLAKCLIDSGDHPEAERLLVEMTEKKDESALSATCCLGRLKCAQGDLLQSEAILTSVRRTSVNSEVLATLGQTLCAKEQYQEAEEVLEDALALLAVDPGHEYMRTLNCWCQCCAAAPYSFSQLEKKFQGRLEQLVSAAARPYQIAEALTLQANAYAIRGYDDAAISLYFQALRLYRSQRSRSWYVVRVLRNLCTLISQYRSPMQTVLDQQLQQALEVVPAACVMMAADFLSGERDRASRTYGEKLVQLRAARVDATGEILETLLALSFSMSILTECQQYIQEFPESVQAARLTAALWKKSVGAPHDVKSLRLSPAELTAICLSTVADFSRCTITVEPDEEGRLGTNNRDIGDRKEEAEAYLQQALAFSRGAAPVSFLLSDTLLEVGCVYEETGNTDEAEKHYNEALETAQAINPNSQRAIAALLALGKLYERQYRDDEAKGILQHAAAVCLRLSPSHTVSVVLTHFYSFCVAVGLHAEAVALFQAYFARLRELQSGALRWVEMCSVTFPDTLYFSAVESSFDRPHREMRASGGPLSVDFLRSALLQASRFDFNWHCFAAVLREAKEMCEDYDVPFDERRAIIDWRKKLPAALIYPLLAHQYEEQQFFARSEEVEVAGIAKNQGDERFPYLMRSVARMRGFYKPEPLSFYESRQKTLRWEW